MKILADKTSRFVFNLRQPINNTKQLAYRLTKLKDPAKIKQTQERIITSAEKALKILKKFEETNSSKASLRPQADQASNQT